MPRSRRLSDRAPMRALRVLAALLVVGAMTGATDGAHALDVTDGGTVPAAATPSWSWPGGVAEVIRPYERPRHEYGPGHRGIDVAVAGVDVASPADGVVAFRGTVVDRPLITIDHGGGLVSTLEPVDSALSVGDRVARGQVIGTLASGGHTPAAAVHLGARRDGDYVNPLALLGAAQRPVLLPCCAPLG